MIKPEDCEFHFKPDSHWQWVETYAFPFSVKEANINGIVYVLARPMLGVCMSDITLMDRISDLCEEQLYIDNQQHMPCPKSLLDFTLPNGLSFKVVDPLKHYRLIYEGIDDTRFKLDYFGLHDPFDINDPSMDPTAASAPALRGIPRGRVTTTRRTASRANSWCAARATKWIAWRRAIVAGVRDPSGTIHP